MLWTMWQDHIPELLTLVNNFCSTSPRQDCCRRRMEIERKEPSTLRWQGCAYWELRSLGCGEKGCDRRLDGPLKVLFSPFRHRSPQLDGFAHNWKIGHFPFPSLQLLTSSDLFSQLDHSKVKRHPTHFFLRLSPWGPHSSQCLPMLYPNREKPQGIQWPVCNQWEKKYFSFTNKLEISWLSCFTPRRQSFIG